MDTPDKTNFERTLVRRLLWALSAVLALIGLVFAVGIGLVTESYVVVVTGAVLIVIAAAAAAVALSLRSSASKSPR
jgi:hypothetical protein